MGIYEPLLASSVFLLFFFVVGGGGGGFAFKLAQHNFVLLAEPVSFHSPNPRVF